MAVLGHDKVDPALQDPLGQSMEALKGQELLLRRLAGVSTEAVIPGGSLQRHDPSPAGTMHTWSPPSLRPGLKLCQMNQIPRSGFCQNTKAERKIPGLLDT